MRVVLDLPKSWSRQPTSATCGDVQLSWFGLELAPDDPRTWIRRELGTVEIVREEQVATSTGWPLLMMEARVGGEYRLVALMSCFEHAGVVIARSTTPLRDDVRELIRAVRPILNDAPTCLAELLAELPASAASVRSPNIAPTVPPIAPVSPEQIAAWEASPDDVDAWFNAGLAHYGAGRFEAARVDWQRAHDLAPTDFDIAHKCVQALHALGRDDEAALALEQLREQWRSHEDPAIRARDEVVIDQFVVAGRAVQVVSTLRPRDPTAYAITTFKTVDGAVPVVIVRIETSDYARLRGSPFVLSIECNGSYRAVGAKAELPAYRALVATATELIRDATSPVLQKT